MTRPADAAIREQALDVTQSFAVTAPAGSGKTELLMRRFLKLLALSEQPENVLCITFTRKAAEEMRERIVAALERGLRAQPDDDTQRETWQLTQPALKNMQARDWHLLQNTNRLQIMTIDSLCRKLAQHLPFESGLGSLPGALDTPEALHQQAARNTLARLETDASLRPALHDFLLHLDNDFLRAEKLITQLLGKREQWFPHLLAARGQRTALENNTQALLNEALTPTAKILSPFAATLLPLLRFAADNLRDTPNHFTRALSDIAALPSNNSTDLPIWRAIAGLLLTGTGSWRVKIDKTIGFPADKTSSAQENKQAFSALLATLAQDSELLLHLQAVRALPNAHYDDHHWLMLEHATTVMMHAVAELKLLFSAQQQSDFTDITLAALTALGDEDAPTDLALRLDYRIQHILVDEFQDTAKPQYDLLAKLTAGWQDGDGRTLFVVGDAMQSCYGFREANVGIFMKARRQGIGHVSLRDVQLSVNFRSQENIVAWVNQTFSAAFPATEDLNSGATTYCTAIAAKPPLTEAAVLCHGFFDDDGSAQAETIASSIRVIQQQHPQDSIALLVRSRANLYAITPVLRAHGIDWQATDIEPLAGQMAVLDMFTLTRALLSSADDMAWMALLRTPWLGLCNADLLALALHRQQQTQTLWQSLSQWHTLDILTADTQRILQRTTPVLAAAMQHSLRKSLRERVQGCWQALGGPLCLRSSAEHEHCQRFLALLEQHEQGGALVDMALFERALDKLYANAPVNSTNPVQIMTMHKSKGLQFDHVFLPQLGRGSRGNDAPLLLWHEYIHTHGNSDQHDSRDERLLIDMLPETGQSKSGTLYDYLGNLKKQKEQHETLRVLYVACTRAIKRLYLLASVSTPKEGKEPKPAANTMLNAIWPVFSATVTQWTASENRKPDSHDDDEEDDEAPTQPPSSLQETLTQLRRLPADFVLPAIEADQLLHHWRGHEYANTDDPRNCPTTETPSQLAARLSGTLLHRLLKCVSEDGASYWPTARIEKLCPHWQQQLQAQGLTFADADTHSARIAHALRNTLQDTRGLWILDSQHSHSACEMALCDSEKTHVIDRTFVEQTDTGPVRWIIDYKLAEPASDEPPAQFLLRQSAQYREQLQRYAQVFAALGERNVHCALYFPLNGLWLEIPPLD